jgi:hypothetical protein
MYKRLIVRPLDKGGTGDLGSMRLSTNPPLGYARRPLYQGRAAKFFLWAAKILIFSLTEFAPLDKGGTGGCKIRRGF